jgi:hypothetical protein
MVLCRKASVIVDDANPVGARCVVARKEIPLASNDASSVLATRVNLYNHLNVNGG